MNKNNLPIVVVTGVLIFNKKGDVLLCKKQEGIGPYPGCWLTPGGGIDDNETLDNCATREVYEETGVTISNLQRRYFSDFITNNWKGNRVQFVAVLYTADYVSGDLEATENDDDHMEHIAWFAQSQLKNLQLNPPLIEFLTYLGIL